MRHVIPRYSDLIEPEDVAVSVAMATGVTWLPHKPDTCDDDPDDEHDNEADGLTKCGDCKGSGWYVGIIERRRCPTCDGAGWV